MKFCQSSSLWHNLTVSGKRSKVLCDETKRSYSSLKKTRGQTKGIGIILLKMHDGIIKRLTNVRYIPDLNKNIISLGVLDFDGYKITLEDGNLKVVRGTFVAMKGAQKANLYFLDGSTVTGRATVSSGSEEKTSNSSCLWHMHLGHAEEKALQGLVKQGPLKGAKTQKFDFCDHCVLGKQTRVKFNTVVHRTKGTLDYIHINVLGPSKNASLGSKRWFMIIIDDFSRYVWTTLVKENESPNTPFKVELEIREDPENIIDDHGEDESDDQEEISVEVEHSLPVIDDDVPCTYREAVQSVDVKKCKLAMDEEMKSLHQN
uniref:GAG-pre-integrase domain-containing protein n=1 Tax=Cannabis sativa TaxID=3483 RepID=A0A803NN06_CANSA